MGVIKKFGEYSIPIASKEDLTSFYSCDECDSLWKMFNSHSDKCPYCDSTEIEELDADEWYELAKDRLDDEEKIDIDKERNSSEFVDLIKLKDYKNVN
jgi:hypothetical protein